ncbi:MAG TPA: DUF1800 domain-containing protein [Ferruginibacter sp.]|nr:DUF1800 domain-containing protein [Ferruginibacter sp.]
MIITSRLKNQHLLWRAAFGPMAENAAGLDDIPQKKLWELLVKTSSPSPVKIEVAENLTEGLYKGIKDLGDMQKAAMNANTRKKRREQSRDELKNLNLLWLDEMINSEAQLREKMSLFWHGHFACRVINSFFQQELLHTIRTNALGNFGDLLKAVSKSPSMLQFLNNQQNRKQHPNENFAREVMELFTMGRGNYSENDIKEAARAFTGWGFNLQGEFIFRKQAHDNGNKTFLGRTGNFDGEDVLNILLENNQTAKFITHKIYRYFVNENADESKVEWLSKRFYSNNYNIKKLLEDIYTSEWFYDEKNIGTRIKSPVELLAGIRRFLPLQLDNDLSQLLFQKVLGQVLFYPPNVAGWPGGKSWIDSSTLMVRLQIPQVLASKESISIRAKNDDDVNMGQVMEEQVRINKNKIYAQRGGGAEIEWSAVAKIFEKVSREQLAGNISAALLQTGSRISNPILDKYLNKESREIFIKSAVVNLMSTPEYQLC